MTGFEEFRARNGLKKNFLAEYLGVSNAFITQLSSGDRPIPEDKLKLIKANNEGWDVSMFQTSSDESPKATIVWDETERHMGVPIYDIDFACSFIEMCNDFSSHPIGWLSLPPFNDPEKYAVVRAFGDSMSPDIEHGALIVLGRQPLHVDRIFYGDMYGIETVDDMRSIKRIVRSEDESKVRLVPSNPAYGDYQDYPAEAIRRVYKVYHVLNQRSY